MRNLTFCATNADRKKKQTNKNKPTNQQKQKQKQKQNKKQNKKKRVIRSVQVPKGINFH